jgi:hypothetical protein
MFPNLVYAFIICSVVLIPGFIMSRRVRNSHLLDSTTLCGNLIFRKQDDLHADTLVQERQKSQLDCECKDPRKSGPEFRLPFLCGCQLWETLVKAMGNSGISGPREYLVRELSSNVRYTHMSSLVATPRSFKRRTYNKPSSRNGSKPQTCTYTGGRFEWSASKGDKPGSSGRPPRHSDYMRWVSGVRWKFGAARTVEQVHCCFVQKWRILVLFTGQEFFRVSDSKGQPGRFCDV